MNKKLFFFLLIPVLGMSQVQIGQDIDGVVTGDSSGYSVSLSADGNIVAIGAVQNNNGTGHVRVYENISGVWTQIGDDIDGESQGDSSGFSVSLSADGSIVAIGAPHNDDNGSNSGHVRVYENILGVWTQIGNDIDGEAANNMSGASVSLSSNGSIVAIGAYGNNGSGSSSGHVRIYKNISGVWIQVGADIDGETTEDMSGWSISLSSEGTIGAPQNAAIANGSGYVRVYENVTGVWTQIGGDINGKTVGDRCGSSVSLSSGGTIVAIGVYRSNNLTGHVQVYENISGVWTQIGDDIDAEAAEDQNGWSVSLSSDGSIVAIGAPHNDGNGSNSGHVRVYENILGVWTQIGNDIDGRAAGGQSGWSVSLSSDGSMVAIGSPYGDTGHVRVYQLKQKSSSSSNFVSQNLKIYPNPTSDVLNINLENNLSLENVTVYNNLGQIVKTAQQNTIDVSTFSPGVYFVEITTNQGKAVKKVIVK